MPEVASMHIYPTKGLQGYQVDKLNISQRIGAENDRQHAVVHPEKEAPHGWAPPHMFLSSKSLPAMVAQPWNGIRNPNQLAENLQLARPLKVISAAGHVNLTDTEGPTVSLLNIATYRLFQNWLHTKGHIKQQKPLNPQRFRMNLQISDWEPFAELDLADTYPGTRQITIGNLRFEVHNACERCRATQANPETGAEDLAIPKLLQQFMKIYYPDYKSPQNKHKVVMGLLLRPLDSGTLKLGDKLHA